MTAAILCDGLFPKKAYPLYLLETADAVVCCDGAVRAYERHFHRLPDAIVGDMDTLSAPLQRKYAAIIHRDPGQDDNDQTKAMRYVLEHYPEVTEIHILGAGGRREDHTVGNLGLLMEYPRLFALEGISVDMVSDYGTAFAVTDSCSLQVGTGRRFSLFSPDNSLRIHSEGLEYQTDGVVFDNWWQATLNRAVADEVQLHFSHPSRALVILD
jgi:thiamine pyrophosphokinase